MSAPEDATERLRFICMALPGAEEEPFGGHTAPCWRVKSKLFAMLSEDLTALTIKAQPGAQEVLVGSQPETFFVPRYVGHRGWIGVRLDGSVDWDAVEGLIFESWAMTAPKAVVKAARGV